MRATSSGLATRPSGLWLRVSSLNPVTLEFTAAPEVAYVLLFRDALDSGPWQQLAHIASAPHSRTVQAVDLGASLTRFYTIRTE